MIKAHSDSRFAFLRRHNTCQALFYGLITLYAFIALVTLNHYGIHGDEPGHVRYGQDILRWYQSLFQDQSVFQSRNTWLYGGAFDAPTALIARIVPLNIYTIRHFCNILIGLLGIVTTYRLDNRLNGPTTGLLAALFLVLTPRYYVSSFSNTKDIPFAVGYLLSLDYLVQCLHHLPRLPRHLLWKTGLAIGLTLGIRAGGLVLLVYLILFFGLYGLKKGDALHLAKKAGIIALIAYSVMLIAWPFAQVHPITGPLKPLQQFAHFPESHLNFFEGRYVESTEIPWYYAPGWLLLTLPDPLLLGLLLAFLLPLLKRPFFLSRSPSSLILFATLFPLFYAILSRTPLYNGPRHILFIIPPLAVLGALGIHLALNRFVRPLPLTICTGLLLALTLWEAVRLHPHQDLYFNLLIAGGLRKAWPRYRTDPDQNSYKKALRWIEQHYANKPPDRNLYISGLSTAYRQPPLTNTYTFVDLPDRADLHLSSIWADRHTLIPGEVLHIVQADNLDLFYVLRPDNRFSDDPLFTQSPYKYLFLGDFYTEHNDPNRAVAAYQQALKNNIQDIITIDRTARLYRELAALLLSMNQLPEASQALENSLNLNPDNLETQQRLKALSTP